jgi:outer membrane immunogenic protein
MLRKTIFATPAIAAVIGTPAMAADMPVKAPLRAPVPVATTWTGCYVNGGVGYGLNNQDHFPFTRTANFRDETSGGRGWLGTVGGGCDYQFNPGVGWGTWVVGAFADYALMDLHSDFEDFFAAGPAPRKEDWAAAVGGRIGFLIAPQVLTYVNGGWTSTRFSGVNFPPTGAFSLPAHTFSGGFIGGGTEVAVAAVPGLYWRNEYRLSSYQPDNLQRLVNGIPTNLFSHQSVTAQTITTSLVLKFH